MLGIGVQRLSHRLPPATNRLDRETCRVVIDPDTDPAQVVGHVVYTVRCCSSEFRDQEVMNPHMLGLSLRPKLSTSILKVADQFLLLVSTEITGEPAAKFSPIFSL